MTFANRAHDLLVEIEHLQLDINIRFGGGHLQACKVLVRSSNNESERRQKDSKSVMFSVLSYEVFVAPEDDVSIVWDVVIAQIAAVKV